MARARNIKPSFFMNEFLAAKPPEVRLLFIGLWTLADREGRLEDRPSRIKGALFPYEDIDVDAALNELAKISDPFQDSPFLIRYRVGTKRYIQICKFAQHQAPHVKEVASTIPPCTDVCFEQCCDQEISASGASTEQEPCAHHTSTVQARCATGVKSPESPFPLPPSINKGARASEPESSNSETDGRDWRSAFPNVRIPKFILDDPEWMSWLAKWFGHLLEKSRLDPSKKLTDISVQNHVDELAGRQRDRCIEVISHSISAHSWKLYWDHYARKPPVEKNPDEPKKPRKRKIFDDD